MSAPRSRTMTICGLLAVGLLASGCGGDGEDGSADGTTGDAATSEAVTVQLDEQNDSGVSGEATLTAEGEDQTKVVLELEGGDEGTPHPVHVHAGTCEELGDVEHPLTNVEGGTSETTIDVALEELQEGEFAINAHESAENLENYIACGVIE